ENHALRLTYDHFDQDMEGEALSSYSATVIGLTAQDEAVRDRISMDWRFDNFLGLNSGSVSAFWQDATTRQFTFEDRTPAVDRTRDVTFDNSIWGLAAQGSKSFGSE